MSARRMIGLAIQSHSQFPKGLLIQGVPRVSQLGFILPQLASSVDQPPPRAGWIHEVKHNGYRTFLIIERRKARAYRTPSLAARDAGDRPILAPYWIRAPRSGCIAALLQEQFHSASP